MQNADEAEFQQAVTQARRSQRAPKAPVRIADVVNRLVARRGYAQLQQGQAWETAWRAAVGERLAESCRPGRMNRGVLEITVRNSAALQELTFQKKKLLKQLQETIEESGLRDLRFRIGEFD